MRYVKDSKSGIFGELTRVRNWENLILLATSQEHLILSLVSRCGCTYHCFISFRLKLFQKECDKDILFVVIAVHCYIHIQFRCYRADIMCSSYKSSSPSDRLGFYIWVDLMLQSWKEISYHLLCSGSEILHPSLGLVGEEYLFLSKSCFISMMIKFP